MTVLPRTIHLGYPDKLQDTIATNSWQLPSKLHLRGCDVREAVRNRQGQLTRILVSSEYDAVDTVVFELRMLGENVAEVVDVTFEATV